MLILCQMFSDSPLLYNSYMRRKVNRWYKEIRAIEMRADGMDATEIDVAIAELEQIDAMFTHEISVSSEYMPNLFELRTHIDYVIQQLQKRRATVGAIADDPASPDASNTLS